MNNNYSKKSSPNYLSYEQIMLRLIYSAIYNEKITDMDRGVFTEDILGELYTLSRRHDIVHLIGIALKNNSFINEKSKYDNLYLQEIMRAVYRYERINCEYKRICEILEKVAIDYIPLKGSIIRKHYVEPWMRTSCDIDILIHREDLERCLDCLICEHGYTKTGHSTHDVSLRSQSNVHIEIHYELVEDYYANKASNVLNNVWQEVILKEGCNHHYEMKDEFFYFYHIAHMAKHFYEGGCGIRPFIDLHILDNIESANLSERNKLLERGQLLDFANSARNLSNVWFGNIIPDELMMKMQQFILTGGVYGNSQNRVAIQRTKKGGKIRYLFSRIFISNDRLRRYYPVLEKYPWLTLIMQVRRWGKLLRPNVAEMAKNELNANKNIEKNTTEDMNHFLNEVGL